MRALQGSPAPARLAETRAPAYLSGVKRRCAARIPPKAIMLTRFLRRQRARRFAWSKALDFTHPRVTAALSLFQRYP